MGKASIYTNAMAAKRIPGKKKAAPKAVPSQDIQPTGETAESRVLLLFEQMQGQIQGIAEGVTGINRRVEELRIELKREIDEKTQILAIAIRQNSADIRQNSADIRKNSEDIEALKRAVERLEVALDTKASVDTVAVLEHRVAQLETNP